MIELSPLAPAFLLLAISEMALGTYVLVRGRLSPVNRAFFALTVLAGVGSLLDLLVASDISQTAALWTFRLLILLMGVEMGVAFHLATLVPHPMPKAFFGRNRRAYWAGVLAIALAATVSVEKMVPDDYGWVPSTELAFTLMAVLLFFYLALLVSALYFRWEKLVGLQRKQAVLFTFALSLPASVMIVIMVLEMAGARIPRMYGLGELVTVVVVAFGIVRYQLFIPPRVQEKAVPQRQVPSLERGRAYLFESASPDRMFESLIHEMSAGTSALIISRIHPDHLRSRYQLLHTPIIWLAESPGPDRVDPSNLQLLTHMTTGFIEKGPSIVALEGIEHLLLNNDQNKVFRFLGQLRDEMVLDRSVLLVSADPSALTDKQRGMLERELEIVKE
jgi:hypothetical protein